MAVARHRARLAIAVAVALVVAACTEPGSGHRPGTDPTGEEEHRSGGGSGGTTQVRHTVEPPPEFDGRRYGDDLLLVSTEPIPDEVVERLERIRVAGSRGVTATMRLGIGQASTEGRVYNVAAVDPAEYRRWTGAPASGSEDEWEDVWTRVAGGEIAMSVDLQGRLPVDADGYLAVGTGEQTHAVHVGAYTQHIDTVDAVVNTEWGEELGLPHDNALLLHTGQVAPQAVRTQVRRMFGQERFSITALDIVAQAGIDLDTFQSVQPVGTFADAVGVYRYTPTGGGQVRPDPSWVSSHIVTEVLPVVGQVTCNRYMIPQLRGAMIDIQRAGLADEIYTNNGCYNPRFIAGSSTLSNHAFGLAIDLNAADNQRGTVGRMHRGVVAIFERWGFAWGGYWDWTDPMHFELRQIVSPSDSGN